MNKRLLLLSKTDGQKTAKEKQKRIKLEENGKKGSLRMPNMHKLMYREPTSPTNALAVPETM